MKTKNVLFGLAQTLLLTVFMMASVSLSAQTLPPLVDEATAITRLEAKIHSLYDLRSQGSFADEAAEQLNLLSIDLHTIVIKEIGYGTAVTNAVYQVRDGKINDLNLYNYVREVGGIGDAYPQGNLDLDRVRDQIVSGNDGIIDLLKK